MAEVTVTYTFAMIAAANLVQVCNVIQRSSHGKWFLNLIKGSSRSF